MPLIRSIVSRSPRTTNSEEEGYESIVCEDEDIGQEANCTRDFAAFAEGLYEYRVQRAGAELAFLAHRSIRILPR
jgi:hypothetical protein